MLADGSLLSGAECDLTVAKLDPIVLVEDARLHPTVVLVRREIVCSE